MNATIHALKQAFVIACMLVILAGCSRKDDQSSGGMQPESGATEATLGPTEEEFRATLPHPRTGEYVGSGSCKECHKDQFESWHQSYHRTMTQIAGPESVKADFDNVVLETDTTRFTLFRKGEEYWVRMGPLVISRPESGQPPGLEVRLGVVTGSHHMQVFWAPEGGGNMQIGFPFTWLIPEKRWVPRNSTFVRPPDMAHRSEVWNVVCSRCHTTGVEPGIDMATRTIKTRVGELGIACEACHGPGQRHTEIRQAAKDQREKPLEPGEIVHPEKLTAERSAQVCGFCHSMKWFENSAEWREHGFEFRPGDDLEKTTPIISPSRTKDVPGLAEFLSRNPDIMNDFFWPDGMVRVSGREFNGVMESPCYQGKRYSCISCHSLHESEPDDQLARKAQGKGACTQCHEKFKEEAQVAAHSRHQAGSSGSDCYNCHMPHTSYGILKAIRSHQISSPSVATDFKTGRPNACNLCHLDKSLEWTAEHLSKWYGQAKTEVPKEMSEVPHATRLALAGDAGQRVLMAWHLGWEDALKTSGTNEAPALLGQLLDDPYSAVRCVAERSLRKMELVPAGYDFTVDPRNRSSARELVWKAWRERAGAEKETQRSFYDRWVAKRDDRPIRLRE